MASARYKYLENVGYADAAFEAHGKSIEELFRNAADALTHLMVDELGSIESKVRREIRLKGKIGPTDPSTTEKSAEEFAFLLHDFLEKIIYWKDVDQLLLRVSEIEIRVHQLPQIPQTQAAPSGASLELIAQLDGEPIDPERHALGTDVKAVTFHRLRVWKEKGGWGATVLVDV